MESDAHQDIGGRDLSRPMRRISRHQLTRMVARRPLAQPLFTMPERLRRGFLRQRASQHVLQDVAGRPAATRADFSRLPGDCGAARPTICGSESALEALELDFFQARLAHMPRSRGRSSRARSRSTAARGRRSVHHSLGFNSAPTRPQQSHIFRPSPYLLQAFGDPRRHRGRAHASGARPSTAVA